MILAILIGMYMGLYNISIALFFYLEAMVLLASIILKNKKVLYLFFIILISFSYAKCLEIKYDEAFLLKEDYYIAKVVSMKEETKYYNKYVFEIKSGKYENYKVLAYAKKNFEYGDIVKFSEEIEKTETARNDKRI